jgi:(E)-2-((N-methylformamido)methylene)succinate hydrolase
MLTDFEKRQGSLSDLPDINYTDSDPDGEKTPVVLIHGVGGRLNYWDPLIPWLSDTFRVIAYDLRGHGDSDKPAGPYTLQDMVLDYTNLLDRLGIERAHVVGQSLGGMIVEAIGVEAPERVRKLVILSAPAGRDEKQQASVRERAATLREHGPAEMARRSIDRWFSKEAQAADPALAERTIARFAANDPAGYLAAYEMFAESEMLPHLGKVSAETLVATGDGDAGSTPEMAHRMGQVIPNAKVQIFHGVKHDIFDGDSGPVCSAIADFLNAPSAADV